MRVSLAVMAYVACIFLANWAIEKFGIVPVGLGLSAPAGVYFAGLTFSVRDLVQEWGGRKAVVFAILIGGLASWWVASAFAMASVAAFLISEFADFSVYTPLRERSRLGALLLSNTVGAVLDSAVFLWLAFGSLEFIEGQVYGKMLMCLPVITILFVYRGMKFAER